MIRIKLRYIITVSFIGLLLLNLFWSVDGGGNLNVYFQNEYGIVKEGRYDIQILVDQKQLISDSIFYDQLVPESNSKWVGPGFHTIIVKSESLNVSYTEEFFLFSTTWVMIEIFQDDVGFKIRRWPILLQ